MLLAATAAIVFFFFYFPKTSQHFLSFFSFERRGFSDLGSSDLLVYTFFLAANLWVLFYSPSFFLFSQFVYLFVWLSFSGGGGGVCLRLTLLLFCFSAYYGGKCFGSFSARVCKQRERGDMASSYFSSYFSRFYFLSTRHYFWHFSFFFFFFILRDGLTPFSLLNTNPQDLDTDLLAD